MPVSPHTTPKADALLASVDTIQDGVISVNARLLIDLAIDPVQAYPYGNPLVQVVYGYQGPHYGFLGCSLSVSC